MAAALLFIPLACLGVGLLWFVWGPKKSSGQASSDEAAYGAAMPPLLVRERVPLPPRPEQNPTPTEAGHVSDVPSADAQSGEMQLDEETIRAINELSANVEGLQKLGEEAVPTSSAEQQFLERLELDEYHSDEPVGADDQHTLSDVFGDEESVQMYADVVWDDAWVTAAMDEDDVSPELYGDLNDIFAAPEDGVVVASNTDEADWEATVTAQTQVVQRAVAPPSVEVVPESSARYRRRRSDKRVALAKFPYDPEVWDDPLSPGKRRRLEKRAELDRRRAEELRERTYKRVEKARQKHAELESVAQEETLKATTTEPVAGPAANAEFNDVWSRATLLEAPDKSGIEQPRERVQRKSAKKAGRSKRKAAKAQAKLEKLMERHEKRQELVAKREESNATVAVSEPEDVEGAGAEGVQHTEITDSNEMRDFSANAISSEPEMTIEVLDNLPAAEELVSGEDLSEREQKRAEKKAERESRKLEKLAARDKKRTERVENTTSAKKSKSRAGASEVFEFEPGLGTNANSGAWDEAAITSAAGSAADDLTRNQAELLLAEPEPMTATLWEQALGTEDGLQGASVSSWEAAAHGITEFIDPARGVHATDAEEWVELGEEISDTAEAGPGRGKDAIIESEEVAEDILSSYDTIIEVGTSSESTKKRRFARRKKNNESDDDGGVSIGEWVSEGATLVTVVSDHVDHHSYDLPEPIPDRVHVTFGTDE